MKGQIIADVGVRQIRVPLTVAFAHESYEGWAKKAPNGQITVKIGCHKRRIETWRRAGSLIIDNHTPQPTTDELDEDAVFAGLPTKEPKPSYHSMLFYGWNERHREPGTPIPEDERRATAKSKVASARKRLDLNEEAKVLLPVFLAEIEEALR